MLSVFALGGPAEGVTARAWPICWIRVCCSQEMPLGVSNEFCGKPARIQVEKGAVLICWQQTPGWRPRPIDLPL